jgi:hypothetical protein
MSVIRGLLFDNLGLKFVSLLLAVAVYLHVYTDRPATMLLSFPLQFTDVPDSLSISGPAPAAVQAEIRGTGKQLIRLRLTEPVLKVSLAGVNRGHFERQIAAADLPIDADGGVQVERVLGPLKVELDVDRRIRRAVVLAVRWDGAPAVGFAVSGEAHASPATMFVTGPASAVSAIDTLTLRAVRIEGRRDTVQAMVGPEALPDWCTADPGEVAITVPIARALTPS